MDVLRKAVLETLLHSAGRVSPSEIHHKLGGRFELLKIEAELMALDMEGLAVNEMQPVSRITPKGRKELARRRT